MEPYVTVGKKNYFITLVLGFLIMILSGFYINEPSGIGFGMLGFGLAICLLLSEQKLNSLTK